MTDLLLEQLQGALGDSLAIERELGGGGMSRVFIARDARLDRRVVVKVLHPSLAAGLSAARFEREVTLAARLQHPHVVPLLTAGEARRSGAAEGHRRPSTPTCSVVFTGASAGSRTSAWPSPTSGAPSLSTPPSPAPGPATPTPSQCCPDMVT